MKTKKHINKLKWLSPNNPPETYKETDGHEDWYWSDQVAVNLSKETANKYDGVSYITVGTYHRNKPNQKGYWTVRIQDEEEREMPLGWYPLPKQK